MKKYTKGFTLIELLVVIAIIGILASVVLVSLNSARKKGNDTRVIADVQQMRTWLETQFNGSQYPILGSNANCASGNAGNTGETFANCVTTGPGVATVPTTDANAIALNSDASSQQGAGPGLSIGAMAGNAAYVIRGRLVSDNTKYFCIDSSGGTNAVDTGTANGTNAMRCN